jgi:hypothetical protein
MAGAGNTKVCRRRLVSIQSIDNLSTPQVVTRFTEARARLSGTDPTATEDIQRGIAQA